MARKAHGALATLVPLAAGAAAVYLFLRWRTGSVEPDAPAGSTTLPAASYASGSVADTLDNPAPMVQHPGTLDEFSPDAVNVGGDLPVVESSPAAAYVVDSLVDEPPLEYRDAVSGAPSASLDGPNPAPSNRRPPQKRPGWRDRLNPPPKIVTPPKVSSPSGWPGSATSMVERVERAHAIVITPPGPARVVHPPRTTMVPDIAQIQRDLDPRPAQRPDNGGKQASSGKRGKR